MTEPQNPLPLHECNLNRITASAGAGKTYALTQHFLELLARALERCERPLRRQPHPLSRASGPGAPLAPPPHTWQEILAITFTNKAASEMKERIIGTLKERALNRTEERPGSPLPHPFGPAAQHWVELILRHYSSLNIRTIDSLLTLVVRLASLELGINPGFQLLFDPEEYFTPAYDYLIQDAFSGNQTLYELAAGCCRDILYNTDAPDFMPVNRLREQLKQLCEHNLKHTAAGTTPAVQPANEAVIFRQMQAVCAELKTRAAQLARAIEEEGLDVQKRLLSVLEAINELTPTRGDLRAYSILEKAMLAECCKKNSALPSDAACKAYFRFQTAYNQAAATLPVLRNARKNAALNGFAHVLSECMRKQFKSSGYLPKSMIYGLATRLLADEAGSMELFCRLSAHIRHVLIDEFQDTDREQWRAILPIALEALAQGGSLTCVGDAKQAIYGWRGGDVSLFNTLLTDPDLSRLAARKQNVSLPCNWRSAKMVINHNNLVFSRLENKQVCQGLVEALLPKQDIPPEIVAAAAKQLEESYTGAAQQLPPGKTPKTGLVNIVRLEAEKEQMEDRIANHLRNLLKDNLLLRRPCRDIAVLVRSNRQAFQLADWLTGWGIPVLTENSLLLSRHPLIGQALACLRWLNHPLDNQAFFEFICGKELFGYMAEQLGGPGRAELENWVAGLAADRAAASGAGWDAGTGGSGIYQAFRKQWPRIWELLIRPFYNQAGLMNVYDLVCDLFDRYQAAVRFPQDRVYLLRFKEVVHLAEQEGLAGLPAFLDWWDRHGHAEKLPMPEAVDAVRIMTIHKAKGLEFPVVILPFGANRPKGGGEQGRFVELELDGLHLQTTLRKELGRPYYEDLARQHLEAINVLYVAWTRAGEELYIFNPTVTAKGKSAPQSDNNLPGLLLEMFNLDQDGAEHLVGEIPEVPEKLAVKDEVEVDAVSVDAAEDTAADAPRNQPSASEAIPEALQAAPMHWLPRLKIFRNNPATPGFDAAARGSFIHQCIQGLCLSGSPQADARRAFMYALNRTPFPLDAVRAIEPEAVDALAWLAALPEAALWLENGIMEQVIVDEQGRNRRCDLLVYGENQITVVEFKTGNPVELPAPAHAHQVNSYMELLREAVHQPVTGVLVYLDARKLIQLS